MIPFSRRSLLTAAGCSLLAVPSLAACSTPSGQATGGAGAEGGQWPREFQNADGSKTTIPARPSRVLSTAVTVTGTLLAIDAPVVASAGSVGGEFFPQWAQVAAERKVQRLWAVGSFDAEAVHAARPDLIVVSTSGREALTNQLTELRRAGPTIVVDYGGQDWQSLTVQLGKALGLEDKADAVIKDFDRYSAAAKSKLVLPSGLSNLVSYTGPGQPNLIGRAGGAHAKLLTQLGFSIEDPNIAWHSQPQKRHDFVWSSYENLTQLKAETTFILGEEAKAAAFRRDPVLANLASVKANQVHALGEESFRVDHYSAVNVVDRIVAIYGRK